MLLVAWLTYSAKLLARQKKTAYEAFVTQVGTGADKFGSLKYTPYAPPCAVLCTNLRMHYVDAEVSITMCNKQHNKLMKIDRQLWW